jgi:hypothetical protein
LVDTGDFEPKRLFMRSVYLLVMGLLLGYLAEQQKQLRAEKTVIARVLSGVRVENGLPGTLQEILSYLSSMHGAKVAFIATNETGTNRIYLGEVRSLGAAPPSQFWRDVAPSDREMYLGESETDACYLDRGEGTTEDANFVALDRDGTRPQVFGCDHLPVRARVAGAYLPAGCLPDG